MKNKQKNKKTSVIKQIKAAYENKLKEMNHDYDDEIIDRVYNKLKVNIQEYIKNIKYPPNVHIINKTFMFPVRATASTPQKNVKREKGITESYVLSDIGIKINIIIEISGNLIFQLFDINKLYSGKRFNFYVEIDNLLYIIPFSLDKTEDTSTYYCSEAFSDEVIQQIKIVSMDIIDEI
jgi:hypothetical protein